MRDSSASRGFVDKEGRSVEIAPVSSAHHEGVTEMYREYPTEHRSHGLPPVLDDELEAWLESLHSEGRAFVALVDGQVVGHAAYTPVTAVTPDFVVFVDPEYQNRGIGTALLYHVVRNAAAQGFDGIVSYVDRGNESAVHVYEKIGFEDVERGPLVAKMRLDFAGDDSGVDESLEELFES